MSQQLLFAFVVFAAVMFFTPLSPHSARSSWMHDAAPRHAETPFHGPEEML
jgi:hypothetical protein